MALDGEFEDAAFGDDDFGRFVGVLTESLRAPASIDDLARSMFLSRSQLGRIVVAVFGEAPARFQRRVLLERAALRLITTRSSVLEIAREAGFDSHEGFIRAFERAYAVSPSAWRSSPGRIALPTPNGVHFQPPSGLRLPSQERMSTMDVFTGMLEHHIWLTGQLIERAQGLPQEVLDEPLPSAGFIDDAPSIRSLLSRLVGQLHMWNEVMAARGYDFAVERAEPLDAMRERWRSQAPLFLGHVRTVVDEGRLDDTFVFVEKTGPRLYTYGGLIAHVLTFGAHRRIEVLAAYARHGIGDLGFGDPREWIPEHAGGGAAAEE
ncbi:helix-turn-helix domain-containing protein [Rathayibacter sp. YIM 133350]|uniref:helix-turn-helix domain-containing protein n=1 Tax=Rathayibacter sp. YIM 133350 TaxID=3131992 RepID=UPI00307E4BD8